MICEFCGYYLDHDQLDCARERIAKLEDEASKPSPLTEFGAKVLEEVKECIVEGGFEIECETLADFAVEFELMQYVPYDPDKHALTLDCEVDPGSNIYYWGK